jgi:hypothetical protein
MIDAQQKSLTQPDMFITYHLLEITATAKERNLTLQPSIS